MWKHKAVYQLTPEEVVLRARKLGVPEVGPLFGEEGTPEHEIFLHGGGPAAIENLRRYVLNAEREKREWQLWTVAFVSALASVFSAAAAWLAFWVTK